MIEASEYSAYSTWRSNVDSNHQIIDLFCLSNQFDYRTPIQNTLQVTCGQFYKKSWGFVRKKNIFCIAGQEVAHFFVYKMNG